jgi:pimeloyl-ACP methyl ester carboxylesterase
VVAGAGVDIAVRDFGGEGRSLLLVHGAGGNLAGLPDLAEALAAEHRVVALDLRGHGRSGDGPWEWDAVLADLDAVVEQLGLGSPAIVGISLGGMLATLWASAHPDCPGAVSLDGNPTPSRPDQLPGLDEPEAELARLRAAFASVEAALTRPMTEEALAMVEAGHRAMAARYGLAEQAAIESFRRNLAVSGSTTGGSTTGGSTTVLRPDAELVAQLRRSMEALDLLPTYRTTRAPLLLVLATEDLAEQRPFHELYAAHRAWLLAETTSAARENPRLRVLPLAGASHAMAIERPAELAELITDFLAGR